MEVEEAEVELHQSQHFKSEPTGHFDEGRSMTSHLWQQHTDVFDSQVKMRDVKSRHVVQPKQIY